MIVQFRASSIEDIKKHDCVVDCCVIPREFDPHMPGQCTMQFALYRLFWRGWKRLCATMYSTEIRRSRSSSSETVRTRKSVVLENWTRHYIYWSGETVWRDNHGRQMDHHPTGYRRDFFFDQVRRRDGTSLTVGYWVWMLDDKVKEKDTGNCFIIGYF